MATSRAAGRRAGEGGSAARRGAGGSAARRGAGEGGGAGRRATQGGSGRGRAVERGPGRRHADAARRAAFDVLRAVAERDAYANLLLPVLLSERGLTGRDAALATELAYGTLRGQGSYDAILAICSDRDLERIDPPLRPVLRLGAHQLLATRVGAHAAVATSVDLARDVAGSRPAGFVNAVLRRVATRDLAAWLEIAAPSRADDLAGHLSVRHSHPRWIVSAFAEALGEDPAGGLAETEAALAADGERPLVTLCAVPGRADAAELAASGARPARWSPFGAYLAEGDPARLPAVAEGRAGVQDEASQLAALALARVDLGGQPPQTPPSAAAPAWLDLCAGPGGKARLLAGLAGAAGARLLAADVRPHRARLVRAAVEGTPSGGPGPRASAVADSGAGSPAAASLAAASLAAASLAAGSGGAASPAAGSGGAGSAAAGSPAAASAGAASLAAGSGGAASLAAGSGGAASPAAGSAGAGVASARVVVADGTAPAWRSGTFARVLADVPCSGLGALRRRPEGRWRRSPGDVAALGPLQRALLGAALDSAAPGGVVAYVTCSPHIAETRDVVTDVLAGRDDVEVLDAPAVLPEVPGLRCPDPYGAFAQFWPHRHGTDAIFLALLRRQTRA